MYTASIAAKNEYECKQLFCGQILNTLLVCSTSQKDLWSNIIHEKIVFVWSVFTFNLSFLKPQHSDQFPLLQSASHFPHWPQHFPGGLFWHPGQHTYYKSELKKVSKMLVGNLPTTMSKLTATKVCKSNKINNTTTKISSKKLLSRCMDLYS